MPDLGRDVRIAEEILMVDGISGSAKSMLFPILSSFQRVEVQRLEQIYEYLCVLHSFQKIQTDAAITLMRTYADLAIHDNMISREVNFRPKDDSSIFNTPYPWRYLRRLFQRDGLTVLDRIREEKPILHIMTHQFLGVSKLAFLAYGEALRIIQIVRHPLYTLPHWVENDWGNRYGKDPKDLNLWIKYKEATLPWWTNGWEEKYLQLSPIGRSIYSIYSLTERAKKTYGTLEEEFKAQVLSIPFEQFVTDPWSWIPKIESFMRTERSSKTKKMLEKQKCPRILPSGKLNQLREDYLKKIPEREIAELLDQISQDYENEYGRIG